MPKQRRMMVGQQVDAMANPEHLTKLKEGAPVWNAWRAKHLENKIDLSNWSSQEEPHVGAAGSKVDLKGVNFDGVDLRYAQLEGANLMNATLRKANLGSAFLRDVHLSGADLSDATLYGANLSGADLSGAKLIGANLILADLRLANLNNAMLNLAGILGTSLTGATLSETDFTGATAVDAVFADVDLGTAKGLETVHHRGPSTIGIDTIYKSQGNIPESFLRGCGVPDEFITYAKSLVASPIEFYSCFISYSTKDQGFADRLYADLQNKGVRCWFAPEDLKIGERFKNVIEDSIRIYDKLLIVLSESSINSSWVEFEVKNALKKEQEQGSTVLFPVRLDNAVMDTPYPWAAEVRKRHIGDFRNWKDHDSFQKSLDRLLRDLKSRESEPK